MSNYEDDPIDLRAQEQSRAERLVHDRLLRDTEEKDIQWLMNSGRGRRIVWRVLEFAGDERVPAVGNANLTAFALGNMNVGKFLKHQILRICPDQYLLMLKEHWPKDKKNGRDDDGNGHNTN